METRKARNMCLPQEASSTDSKMKRTQQLPVSPIPNPLSCAPCWQPSRGVLPTDFCTGVFRWWVLPSGVGVALRARNANECFGGGATESRVNRTSAWFTLVSFAGMQPAPKLLLCAAKGRSGVSPSAKSPKARAASKQERAILASLCFSLRLSQSLPSVHSNPIRGCCSLMCRRSTASAWLDLWVQRALARGGVRAALLVVHWWRLVVSRVCRSV